MGSPRRNSPSPDWPGFYANPDSVAQGAYSSPCRGTTDCPGNRRLRLWLWRTSRDLFQLSKRKRSLPNSSEPTLALPGCGALKGSEKRCTPLQRRTRDGVPPLRGCPRRAG
jgi:hypothetical protein